MRNFITSLSDPAMLASLLAAVAMFATIVSLGLPLLKGDRLEPSVGLADLARLGEAAPEKSERMNYLQRALTVFRELGAGARMREVQGQMHRAIMGGH